MARGSLFDKSRKEPFEITHCEESSPSGSVLARNAVGSAESATLGGLG